MEIALGPSIDVEEPELLFIHREDSNGVVRCEVGTGRFDFTLACMKHIGELEDLPDSTPQYLELTYDGGFVYLTVSVSPGPEGAIDLIRKVAESEQLFGRSGVTSVKPDNRALFLYITFIDFDSSYQSAEAIEPTERLLNWAQVIREVLITNDGTLQVWSVENEEWK